MDKEDLLSGQTANGCTSTVAHLECVFFGKIAKNKDFFLKIAKNFKNIDNIFKSLSYC